MVVNALRSIVLAVSLLGLAASCGGQVVFEEDGGAGLGGGSGAGREEALERLREACEWRCSYPNCRAQAPSASECARLCAANPPECADEYAAYNECLADCCDGECPHLEDDCIDTLGPAAGCSAQHEDHPR